METATLASSLGQQRPSPLDGREARVLTVPDPVITYTHSCPGQQGRGTGLCSCLAAKVSITGLLMAPKTLHLPQVLQLGHLVALMGSKKVRLGHCCGTDEMFLALPAACTCAFLWMPLVMDEGNQVKVCSTAQQGLRAH